ncbi:hypothetical protein [Bacillus sp. SM2101]|uniref:hypothetical protein n=1 Tax=Bacillus sp. SM2101 TaxID=2805366 RepID=UPI001BDEA7BF|nr:hypothetical protein [Bacillus sp. SM2101]
MKNTKKYIVAASLSALLLGGGVTALNSDVFASNYNTKQTSIEVSQDSIVKAKTYEDFRNIQYEDFNFGEFYGGFSIDYNEDGTTKLTSFTGEYIVVDNGVFEIYSSEEILNQLFENEHTDVSAEGVQELKKKEASIIRMDPWVMLYNEIESKDIDTEGKTFGQLYDESDLKKLVTPINYVSKAMYYGLEVDNKTMDEIKAEVLDFNASIKLMEESRDLPYDPNWLVEAEKWWVEIFGTQPTDQ